MFTGLGTMNYQAAVLPGTAHCNIVKKNFRTRGCLDNDFGRRHLRPNLRKREGAETQSHCQTKPASIHASLIVALLIPQLPMPAVT
jgi:hypothetical protein